MELTPSKLSDAEVTAKSMKLFGNIFVKKAFWTPSSKDGKGLNLTPSMSKGSWSGTKVKHKSMQIVLLFLLLLTAIFQKIWYLPIIWGIVALLFCIHFMAPWYGYIVLGVGMKTFVYAVLTFEKQIDKLVD